LSPPLPPADLDARDVRLRMLPKGTLLHRFSMLPMRRFISTRAGWGG